MSAVRGSTVITLSLNSTWAPRYLSMSMMICTSLMSGTFSITEGESPKRAAGIMATAAFLPPLTVTSPSRRAPP